MLQVGAAIDDIGDGQEEGLRGDTADGIAEREFRVPPSAGGDRGGDAGNRGAAAQQHAAEQRLADAGAVGQPVGGRGHADAGKRDDRRSGQEQYRIRAERKL